MAVKLQSPFFFFEVIMDSEEVVKIIQAGLCLLHLVFPYGYILCNYSTIRLL